MTNERRSKEKGFTLLEVSLALVLFSILLGVAFMLFGDSYKFYLDFQNKSNLLEDSRMVTEFIQEEIQRADYVKFDPDPSPKVVGTTKYWYLTKLTLEPQKEAGIATGRNLLILGGKESLDKPDDVPPQGEIKYQGVAIADNVKYILVEKVDKQIEVECVLKDKIGTSKEEELKSKLLISLKYKMAP